MTHDWILTVLDDLGTFAGLNGLPVTAKEVAALRAIAESEIRSLNASERVPDGPRPPSQERVRN